MSANIQELIIAFSKTAQSDIHTASTDVMRVNLISADPAEVEPVVEGDADEIGKGHEFDEETHLTHWNVSRKMEVYNCVEMLAWCGAFGLGNGTTSSFTPIDPVTNTHEIELPWFTFYEAIRPTGTALLNHAMIGNVISKWSMSVKNGPGKANSKLSIDMVGSGKINRSAALTFPSKTATHLLPSVSLNLAINGFDYFTSKNFESLDFEWDNAPRLDSGFVPSSTAFQTTGDATSGAVRSRMEFGTRKATLRWVGRLLASSTELTTLDAQTSGTAVASMSAGGGLTATLTCNQTRIKMAKIDNTDGIVTIGCEASLQIPAGGTAANLLTLAVTHGLGTIGRS